MSFTPNEVFLSNLLHENGQFFFLTDKYIDAENEGEAHIVAIITKTQTPGSKKTPFTLVQIKSNDHSAALSAS